MQDWLQFTLGRQHPQPLRVLGNRMFLGAWVAGVLEHLLVLLFRHCCCLRGSVEKVSLPQYGHVTLHAAGSAPFGRSIDCVCVCVCVCVCGCVCVFVYVI